MISISLGKLVLLLIGSFLFGATVGCFILHDEDEPEHVTISHHLDRECRPIKCDKIYRCGTCRSYICDVTHDKHSKRFCPTCGSLIRWQPQDYHMHTR